jgi:hypothetical protein
MTYIVFQLTSRQFAHRAAMASHAIVHDDGQIVSAQTHIRLDAIDAALDRRFEGRHRVFRRVRVVAAMSEQQH